MVLNIIKDQGMDCKRDYTLLVLHCINTLKYIVCTTCVSCTMQIIPELQVSDPEAVRLVCDLEQTATKQCRHLGVNCSACNV